MLMLWVTSTSGTTICSTVRDLWERGELSTLAFDEVMRLDPCRTNVSTSFSPTSSSRRSLKYWGKSNSKQSPAKADPTKAWAFKLLGARAAELDGEWSQMQTPTLANFDVPQYHLAVQALWLGLTRTLFTARILPVDPAGGKLICSTGTSENVASISGNSCCDVEGTQTVSGWTRMILWGCFTEAHPPKGSILLKFTFSLEKLS